MKKVILIFVLTLIALPDSKLCAWGFFAHQRINRLAVFSLPPEMYSFYRYYLGYITENAINPDQRRYAVEGEAPRHYLDVDIYDKLYNDSAVYKLPRYWNEAVAKHTEDTLMAYGIVPWQIFKMKYQLTEAFKQKDVSRILRICADLGHYIGDANVPLHTTENYNGQRTNQVGIHGFWESRLPELFIEEYDLFVGQAQYLKKPQLTAWDAVIQAHEALDSVLKFEKTLSLDFPEDKRYTFELRNRINMRTYSREYAKAYHEMLNGQVERQMKRAIKMVADFWYTAWVDAGQPDLSQLLDRKYEEKEKEEEKQLNPDKIRPHDTSLNLGKPKSSPCCTNNRYLAYYRRKAKEEGR